MTNQSIDRLIGQGMDSAYQKLFPYLNIEPVPPVSPYYRDNFFYEVPDTVTATTYFQQLETLKTDRKRKEMESAAATFIATPPPQPQDKSNDSTQSSTSSADALAYFVSNPSQFPPALMPIVNAQINPNSSTRDLQEFVTENAQLMANIDSVSVPIWLSVASLVIQIDYELAWLEMLLALLQKIIVLSNYYQEQLKGVAAPEELVSLWWQANFLLPESVFPLPNAYAALKTESQTNTTLDHSEQLVTSASSSPLNATQVTYGGRYYALGTLHILKYKLVGYDLGELQKVESILRGEMREQSSRQLLKDDQQQAFNDTDRHSQDNAYALMDKELNTYVEQVLADQTQQTTFNNYNTSYTSSTPNATTTGGWTFQDSPAGGEAETHEDFIKKVLTEIQNKAQKEVNEARQTRLLTEREITNTQRFFNKTERNINGFYYWLNKKYQVVASDLQKRLLVEINFPVQSAELENLLEIQPLLNIQQPESLTQAGVSSYTDISDVSDSDLYYLNLAEQFAVEKVPSPPSESLNIAHNSKSDQVTANVSLMVPDGYQTNAINVLVYAASGTTFKVSVGDQNITLTASGESYSGNVQLDANSAINGVLPLSIYAIPSVSQDQSSDNSIAAFSFVTNIQVGLTRTSEHYNQWQYTVYQALLAGYQKQLEQYHAQIKAAEEWLDRHDTPVTRALIDNYIAKQSMYQLYIKAMRHTGGDRSYPNDELPFFQYFESALEWDNLYCKLFEESSDHTDYDLQGITTSPILAQLDSSLYLKRFLVATRAKVLLPVKPDQVLRFLYFLDAGQVWHGEEGTTPVNFSSLAIVTDYKKIPAPDSRPDTNSWNITLPTSMVVLSDDDIRDIGGHLDD